MNENMGILKKDYGVDQIEPEVTHCGIEGLVSVQARQIIEETDWLISIAKNSELVRGVVGWVDLRDERKLGEQLERLKNENYLKGVRHVVHDEPDDNFILGKKFNEGIRTLLPTKLVYDILIFAKHLPNTIQFVDQHPNQVFVVDHIAKPTIRSAEFDATWAKNLKELSKRKNVWCKFSGVVTEVRDPAWDLKSIKPYWDVAIESFGPERLMYGSDWPVCLLRSEYVRWAETVEELTKSLSESESARFWGGNATEAYNL